MIFWNNIQPGDRINRSAARQNDISEFMARLPIDGSKPVAHSYRDAFVTGITATTAIPYGTPVAARSKMSIDGGFDDPDNPPNEIAIRNGYLEVALADKKDTEWGIAEIPVEAAGEIGTARFSGLISVRANITSKMHTHLTPQSGKLVSSDSGRAVIIWRQSETGTDVLCLALLGSGGSGESEYNGYFKVIAVDVNGTQMLKVIDGKSPESSTCGNTDIGSVESVTLPMSSRVYLNASKTDSGYSLWVSSTSGGYSVLLASITNGVIRQEYTEDFFYYAKRVVI